LVDDLTADVAGGPSYENHGETSIYRNGFRNVLLRFMQQ